MRRGSCWGPAPASAPPPCCARTAAGSWRRRKPVTPISDHPARRKKHSGRISSGSRAASPSRAFSQGRRLARLHAALRASRGLDLTAVDAAGVEAAARAGDAIAVETIRLFWRLAARCAGDLALIFLARGGVTLAGGVLPRLVDWLDAEEFRRAFTAKAPMQALLANVPVRLIVKSDAALAGMAALAAAPDAYAIDYAARAWRPAA